ncbi:MAG: non-canonical purine NTP pyrophosphatase [bacterium]|nr:non-canonical purine NTP pyrophosphatase [bacterium]
MELLLATRNPAKIETFRTLLGGIGAELRTLAQYPHLTPYPEDEPTFEANAIGKATWYARATGLPALADDGGLEIEVLDGWPGVHSRRIFGDGRAATDDEMIAEVLRRMEGIPEKHRGCRMRNVLAFVA